MGISDPKGSVLHSRLCAEKTPLALVFLTFFFGHRGRLRTNGLS